MFKFSYFPEIKFLSVICFLSGCFRLTLALRFPVQHTPPRWGFLSDVFALFAATMIINLPCFALYAMLSRKTALGQNDFQTRRAKNNRLSIFASKFIAEIDRSSMFAQNMMESCYEVRIFVCTMSCNDWKRDSYRENVHIFTERVFKYVLLSKLSNVCTSDIQFVANHFEFFEGFKYFAI